MVQTAAVYAVAKEKLKSWATFECNSAN